MNKLISAAVTAVVLLTVTAAHAHDPKMHQQNAQKPDCASMKNMDMSKMDPNDPVAKAMMEKCSENHGDMDHDSMDHSKMPMPKTPATPPTPAPSKHDDHGGH